MAKPSRFEQFSDEDPPSSGDSLAGPEAAARPMEVDEEYDDEIEAIVAGLDIDDDDIRNFGSQSTEDDRPSDEAREVDDLSADTEIVRQEKARLREMQRLKKQKIQQILDEQNAAIDADLNKKGKGRLQYLLQQTEIFAHFANGSRAAVQKNRKGRGRHAFKITEQEEDDVCLKDEENEMDGAGGTWLLTQPSCIQEKMRDYQLAGLNWLIQLYENGINGIIADDMGLGKTLQTISLLGYLHESRGITGPNMVVAPKSTVGNWMREIQRFCPSLHAIKLLGDQDERKHICENLLLEVVNLIINADLSRIVTLESMFGGPNEVGIKCSWIL